MKETGKGRKARQAAPVEPKAEKAADPHEQVAGAHLDKPGAVEHPAADKSSGVTKSEATEAAKLVRGKVAIINKGADKIPVQLKDEAHLARLQAEFGADHVEVQS